MANTEIRIPANQNTDLTANGCWEVEVDSSTGQFDAARRNDQEMIVIED